MWERTMVLHSQVVPAVAHVEAAGADSGIIVCVTSASVVPFNTVLAHRYQTLRFQRRHHLLPCILSFWRLLHHSLSLGSLFPRLFAIRAESTVVCLAAFRAALGVFATAFAIRPNALTLPVDMLILALVTRFSNPCNTKPFNGKLALHLGLEIKVLLYSRQFIWGVPCSFLQKLGAWTCIKQWASKYSNLRYTDWEVRNVPPERAPKCPAVDYWTGSKITFWVFKMKLHMVNLTALVVECNQTL